MRHRKLHPKCNPKRLLDPLIMSKYIQSLIFHQSFTTTMMQIFLTSDWAPSFTTRIFQNQAMGIPHYHNSNMWHKNCSLNAWRMDDSPRHMLLAFLLILSCILEMSLFQVISIFHWMFLTADFLIQSKLSSLCYSPVMDLYCWPWHLCFFILLFLHMSLPITLKNTHCCYGTSHILNQSCPCQFL